MDTQTQDLLIFLAGIVAVGMTVALAFAAFGAWTLGDWSALVAGMLAGFLASVEAGRAYDKAKAARLPAAG